MLSGADALLSEINVKKYNTNKEIKLLMNAEADSWRECVSQLRICKILYNWGSDKDVFLCV